jgi:TPR repeat protein
LTLLQMALPETESLASDAYRAAARRGDVKAHYYMGLMYEHGEGVPQYPAVAAEWHRRAAGPAGDFAPAQACLGAM